MSSLTGIGGRLHRGDTSIDFIGKRRRWYGVSAVLIAVSAIALFTQGLHLGIEFKGGSAFTVTTSSPTIAQARTALTSAGVTSETVIQKIGSNKIRVQTGALTNAVSNAVQDALAKEFNVKVDSIDTQSIGPSWGKEITHKALYGLFGFIFVVMIYLAIAFEPKMAVAAIAAVVHDVFITVGIYALVGFDVTPATVIGFLTILGYSLYDTVVVFDKVRENTRTITSTGKSTYSQAVNLAVNQTLVRSFNTSLIALLRAVSVSWQQQAQTQNAREIAEAAQELFGRVAKFTEHFEKIRSGLERANGAYNDAVGSYERMVRPSGEKILKLGTAAFGKELADISPLEASLRLPPTP